MSDSLTGGEEELGGNDDDGGLLVVLPACPHPINIARAMSKVIPVSARVTRGMNVLLVVLAA
jgi:hypothetical protein